MFNKRVKMCVSLKGGLDFYESKPLSRLFTFSPALVVTASMCVCVCGTLGPPAVSAGIVCLWVCVCAREGKHREGGIQSPLALRTSLFLCYLLCSH